MKVTKNLIESMVREAMDEKLFGSIESQKKLAAIKKHLEMLALMKKITSADETIAKIKQIIDGEEPALEPEPVEDEPKGFVSKFGKSV